MDLYKVVIKFGKWVHKADNLYCYDRIYTNKGKPTIFCIRYFRHVGYEPHKEFQFQEKNMSDFEVVLPTTTEEWQRDMNFAYNQALEDALDVVEWDSYTLDIKKRIEQLKR